LIKDVRRVPAFYGRRAGTHHSSEDIADLRDRSAAALVCTVAAVVVGWAVASGYELAALAVPAAVLFGLLFVRSPAVALLGYVATRPVVDAIVLQAGGAVTVGKIWGVGLLILLVVFLATTEGQADARVPLPVLVLIASYAIFAARGDTGLALEYGLKLAMWLLLIVAVERISRTADGQTLCFKAGYALSVVGAPLIAALIATNNYGASYYADVTPGVEQGPHGLAFLALLAIPFPLIALLHRWKPLLSLTLVGVLAVEITLSYVRTALVALMLIAVVYLFVAIRRRRPTAFVVAGAFAVAAYFVQGRIANRLSDLSGFTSSAGDPSKAGSGRLAIWTAVWDGTTHSAVTAVFGAGAGASNALSKQATGVYLYAHNDFLEFFATGGVVLFAAYVVFIGWAIRSVWALYSDRRQSSQVHVIASIAFAAIAMFLAISFLNSVVFYAACVGFAVLLGLVRGMSATPGNTCFDRPPRSPQPRIP
jgi:O-antigen ligase